MSLYTNSLLARFSRVVDQNPEHIAILFDENDALSYKQLDEYSNQVGRFLLAKGLRRGDRVCIHLEKSPAAYAVVLGCVKTGIAYFAIDPGSPTARLENIFNQCPPSLIFSDSPSKLEPWAAKVIPCPKGCIEFCANQLVSRLQLSDPATPSDIAYIMFTSGSTGSPKGAVITHSNLNYFIDWAVHEYTFTPQDRHTHINPIYFDNSVFDMYSTFFSGGTLVPFTSALLQDPGGVVKKIERLQCSVFFSVPSMLIYLQTTRVIEKGSMPSLRKIIFGGEGYPKTKLAELFECVGQHAQLINVYGPTECTCICSTYNITAEDFKNLDSYPPIGSLITTFNYYLLDDQRAVKPGEVGELCLGGPCVGHGYFAQPELTQKAFVQNPLNTSYEERLYRTGDLMRFDPDDGKLWFVGRKDFQIKHQGYRIELEEIQHALAKVPGVEEAAALQVFVEGASRLIGFIAVKQSLQPEEVRRASSKLLPKYMVPTKILTLDRLPKNPNGKTDRKKLLELYNSMDLQKEMV